MNCVVLTTLSIGVCEAYVRAWVNVSVSKRTRDTRFKIHKSC